MGKVINIDKWRDEHEVLMDPIIDAIPYLYLTLRNALQKLRYKYKRDSIRRIQYLLKEADQSININMDGIVDLNTFAYICMMAFGDKPEILNEIKAEFDRILKEFNNIKEENPKEPLEESLEKLKDKIYPPIE